MSNVSYSNLFLEKLRLGGIQMQCRTCGIKIKYQEMLKLLWLSFDRNIRCEKSHQEYELYRLSRGMLAVLIAISPIFVKFKEL